jgi:hypothetical protein
VRRTSTLLAVAAALWLAAVARADAYVLGGPRWPARTITYWDGGPNPAAVKKAVRAWNRSGARVRFVPARRARADIWISRYRTPCRGYAQIGHDPAVRHAPLRLGRCIDGPTAEGVAAHELGHILGLDHERKRCAAMNATTAALCRAKPYYVPCHPLERDDVRGAIRLYGGRARLGPRRLCPRLGPPEPPAGLRLVPGPDGDGTLELELRPRRVLIPGSFAPRPLITVHRFEDACPPGPPSGEPVAVVTDAAPRVSIPVTLGPGRVCFSVRVGDVIGATAAPATITADGSNGSAQAG